jgi:hypothetical protein
LHYPLRSIGDLKWQRDGNLSHRRLVLLKK